MPAISNVNELQAMENDLAGDYWLSDDIDASATSGWHGGAGFVPIGDAGTPFTGTLDGKGYTISNLFINRPVTDDVGLFGYTEDAIIQDVILSNVDITGDGDVGGLVGYALHGSITDCSTSGTIEGNEEAGGIFGRNEYCTLSDCHSTCNVTGGDATGGFGGFLMDSVSRTLPLVKDCYATGNVAATNDPTGFYIHAGGFIAHTQDAIIEKCFASGDVDAHGELTQPYHRISVGGFVGDTEGTYPICRNCYSKGQVDLTNTGTDHTGDLCGGFIGRTGETSSESLIDKCYSVGYIAFASGKGFCALNTAGSVISDCFWDTETSGTAVSDGGTGKTTSQMKTKSTFTDADWDFIIIWGINGITNDGYPFFWAMPPEPTPDSPRRTVAVQDKITLESIRNVEMAAGGRFYVNEEGNAVYKSRYARNA